MKTYQNILIVKLSSLGDILHASPCAQALRELYPAAKITWIAEKNFAGLLVGAPVLDEVIQVDLDYLREASICDGLAYLGQLKRALRARQFDLVLDMQGLFKSALVAWMTGCKERIGYGRQREGSWLISRGINGTHAKGHVIQAYLDVVRYLGARIEEPVFPLPELEMEKALVREVLLAKLRPEQRFVVFAPGASKANKEWPVAHYVSLAKMLTADGWAVVVAGGKTDVEKGRQLSETVDGLIDLTGKTNLKELAALLTEAALFVSGDTGPLHIAVAVGVPIVSLYGPTRPERTGPYGEQAKVLRAPTEAGALMAAITPRDVYNACKITLQGRSEA